MNKALINLFFLCISICLYPQEQKSSSSFKDIINRINISFESNTQWYLNDAKTGDFQEEEKLRSNSYLRIDYQISKNFSSGFQLESYAPEPLLNYSKLLDSSLDLGTFYVNYKTNKLDFTLGHYYVQFGSGLILRTWEDRALGINNALRGAKIVYQPTNDLRITALYGKQRKGFDVATSDIFGFESNFDIASTLQLKSISRMELGLSYVGKKEAYTKTSEPTELTINIPELVNSFGANLDLQFNNFYTSFEYLYKSKDIRSNNIIPNLVSFSEKSIFDSNAITWNLGYSQKGIGASYSFRRLENMRSYSERSFSNVVNNPTNQLSLNYLPGLTKQHDYTLANIYLYQTQPGLTIESYESPIVKAGEIGQFVDLFYSVKKGTSLGGKYGTKININMSYWASLKTNYTDPSGVPYFVGDDLTYETELLNFDNKLFSDFNLEIRKKWSPKLKSIFTYINLFYNKDYLESKGDGTAVSAWIGIAESTYRFQRNKSLRLELQHLATNDDARNWIGGTMEYFFNSKFGLYINDSYNYEDSKNTENTKIHFFNIGSSYTRGSTRVGVNYGRQRGGLLCVGGVCRPISKNTGVTLNFIASF